jgi:uncharacterized protein (UPF0332 family)
LDELNSSLLTFRLTQGDWINIDELFKQGLLKKIPPSRERAEKSIIKAEMYLSEAKQTLDIGVNDLVIIASYSSIFHSGRSILFSDGIGERSHFAIYQYLFEKHVDIGKEILNAFDTYRRLRHSVAYGLDTKVEKKDAEDIIEFAEEFLEKVKKYLKIEE